MISIIVPVYNAEKYLDRCFGSVLNQSYIDYEVIIVDDGSTDGSPDICKKWTKVDKRFRYFYKTNGGSASARNYGLKKVRGEFISFIDADDYVDINFLKKMYNGIQITDADIVQCSFEKTINDFEVEKENLSDERVYTNIEFLGKFCSKSTYLKTAVLWNKLYKKKLFNNIEFPEGKGIDDEYVICEVIFKADYICEIDDILYFYYMSPNSQMRSKPSLKSVDSVEAIEKQLEFFKRIEEPNLYNSLLYRYYSAVSGEYNLVKRFFPEQEELLKNLKEKLSPWKTALLKREIPFVDKILLIIRIRFPKLFERIHMKVMNE